jgi:hypothetical protein
MFRNQYRNFGTYESFVTCHSVVSGSTSGVRWYEYRKTGSTFSLYQQGTYAPATDTKWRWLGSIAQNANGDIGLIYTASSSTTYPGIYFTGRKAGDALGQMTVAEGTIIDGPNYIAGSATRWGDYSSLSIDPTDNLTFWGTNEYIAAGTPANWPWSTRIASFKFPATPIVTTTAATSVIGTTATLNGSVNPSGFSTDYHFEWGTTTSYGTSTATVNAGSGTSAVVVNANISGLAAGITYHFRLVGVNSEGTSTGNDMTFTPGAAVLTTVDASAITLTGATCGGNISTDGGNTVTARGVCWGATANPTATGNHTTDGAGTGAFVSTITGLSSSTTYHFRAYATSSAGTFYGDDKTFTTLCGIYSLPFTESFTATTAPGCWSQIDHQGAGNVWQFGTFTGTGAPALTGNFAYLNSDNYGSGVTENADLITPTLDLSTYSAVNLSFKHYFKSYSGSSGTLSYSINGGSTWTVISTFTTTSTANPTTFTQAVAAVAGQSNVQFKWNYTGSYGYWWGIDDVNITGTVITSPTVTASVSTLTSFGNIVQGATSGEKTFTAAGVNLTSAITITAPAGFEVSKTTGTGFGSSVTLTPTSGTVPTTTIYVHFVPSAVQAYSGNITLVSSPATTQNVAVSGTGTACTSVSITGQPTNVVKCSEGTSASFTVAATGSNLTYQWRKNTVNITTGGTSATYTISSANLADAGSYDCVVTGTCGTQTSNAATLTITLVSAIAGSDQNVCVDNAILSANDPTPATGKWIVVSGSGSFGSETDFNTTVTGLTDGANTFKWTVTNGTCSANDNIIVTRNTPVSFTTQPVDVNATVGDNVTFTAAASGSGTLSYQWQKDLSNLSNGGTITGALTNTLHINPVASPDAGTYTCVVTGTCGAVSSSDAILTVSVSVEELAKYGISLYPNPSDGKFKVNFDKTQKSVKIEITDISGKVLYQKENQNISSSSIDLSNYAKGLYMIKISTDSKTVSTQLIFK